MIADGLATALFFTSAEKLEGHFQFSSVRMFANHTIEKSKNFKGELFFDERWFIKLSRIEWHEPYFKTLAKTNVLAKVLNFGVLRQFESRNKQIFFLQQTMELPQSKFNGYTYT